MKDLTLWDNLHTNVKVGRRLWSGSGRKCSRIPVWAVVEEFWMAWFGSRDSLMGSRNGDHKRILSHRGTIRGPDLLTFRPTEERDVGFELDGHGACRAQPHVSFSQHPGKVP